MCGFNLSSHSIPLINFSVFMPVPCCFYYYSSVVEIAIRNSNASSSSLITLNYIGYLRFLCFHVCFNLIYGFVFSLQIKWQLVYKLNFFTLPTLILRICQQLLYVSVGFAAFPMSQSSCQLFFSILIRSQVTVPWKLKSSLRLTQSEMLIVFVPFLLLW